MWNFDNNSSIHSQISNRLLGDIASLRLKAGDKMPSVRDLATEAGVNPNTMQRALQNLEDMGYLKSERTQGRYVTEDKDLIEKLRAELLRELVEKTYIKLEDIGLSTADFIRELKKMEEK